MRFGETARDVNGAAGRSCARPPGAPAGHAARLLALLGAVALPVAADAALTLADGSPKVASATVAPGSLDVPIDAFAISSDTGTDAIGSVRVAIQTSVAGMAAVSVYDVTNGRTCGTLAGGLVVGDNDVAFAAPCDAAGYVASGQTVQLQVRFTAIAHAGATGTFAATANVVRVDTTDASEVADGTITVDNAGPANATWGTVTAGQNQIALAWTNPVADAGAAISYVVVLRRQTSGAFTEALEDGAAPPAAGSTTAGGSAVVYSQAGSAGTPVAFTDATALNGSPYVYRVYVGDGCGNWNAGSGTGPHTPGIVFVAEGSTVAGAPMVAIQNPLEGSTVSGTFRVQIRVASGVAQGGIAGTSGLAYSTDDGATWQTSGLAPLTGYDTLTGGVLTGRTWEVHLTPPVAGPYTLRAKVSNGAAADVLSNAVPIVFRASGGAGTLLARDNSSQLCSDCHALIGHTSETTDGARGSWSTTCRDCHTPHGTKNIALVAEAITPPAITAPQTPKAVVFHNKAGAAVASFASPAANGPCQVCHTRTKYYRADGSGAAHDTTTCVACHKHVQR